MKVEEYIKTLKPITDFKTLKRGDKIFNRCSLSVEFVDTFDHIEKWDDEEIIFYVNHEGESWNGPTEDFWFYYKPIERINPNKTGEEMLSDLIKMALPQLTISGASKEVLENIAEQVAYKK
jgi:hypothetical protein